MPTGKVHKVGDTTACRDLKDDVRPLGQTPAGTVVHVLVGNKSLSTAPAFTVEVVNAG
jgi:hypothetical protein